MWLLLTGCATLNPLQWDPGCVDGTDGWSEEGLIYAGEGDWLETHVVRTLVDDETTWASLQQAAAADGVVLDDVDFGTSQVIIGADWVTGTCAAAVDAHGITTDSDGRPYLHALFTTEDATCESGCDETIALIVMYAVARDAGEPRVCLAEQVDCGS